MREMPVLQALYEKWREKDLVILAINIRESKESVAEFVAERGLTFTVLLDISGEVASTYEIQYFPTSYFIDGSGIIRDKVIGAFSDLAHIESRLTKIMP